MIERETLSDERIISCLNTDYGIDVLTLTLLPWGADRNASTYKAKAREGSYFIKIKRGHHHDISVAIVGLLRDAGIQEIIHPVNTLQNQPTQRILDFTLIVYPFVEGENGFTHNLTDEQWIKLGKTLRQIHDIEVPSSIRERIRRETYSPKWREAVRSFYIHIETTSISDEIALNLLKFMKENKLIIQQLVDRAQQLCQKLEEHSPKFVLCHSDIHGGNVILHGNNAIYIVDWDEPIMAPKERDLMFIGGGVANVWNNPHEEALFYRGYGKTEINMAILAYYRHERIVEDIALFIQGLLLTPAGGEDRPVMYKQFIDMFKPNGVVDIAFKTGEGLKI